MKRQIIRNPYSGISLLLFFIVFFSCSDPVGETEREKVLNLLAGLDSKNWIIDNSNIDDRNITLSACDSAYVLTLSKDFTWKEIYIDIYCYPPNYGSWALNDENNVLSIQYRATKSNDIIEKKFEIVELTENHFAYQIPQNNRMKYVRLRKRL